MRRAEMGTNPNWSNPAWSDRIWSDLIQLNPVRSHSSNPIRFDATKSYSIRTVDRSVGWSINQLIDRCINRSDRLVDHRSVDRAIHRWITCSIDHDFETKKLFCAGLTMRAHYREIMFGWIPARVSEMPLQQAHPISMQPLLCRPLAWNMDF